MLAPPPTLMVIMKLRDAMIELTPAECRDRIVRSIELPLCLIIDDRGG